MSIPIEIKKSATADELIEFSKTQASQLKHDGCTILSEQRNMLNTIGAPDNAVAIIVDISAPGGKFVIGRHALTP
ncbi:uncharacterized protein N7518_006879 [Penicillium psychrosexuale]|uniref:uncharacterized protein n=1 Tax=Penicillium psychrosexuale TaxID=1002107 RepID=UPI0025455492|nr:uncharacterized protein N7518_006879 [Penicillium psychrosexuale]KAJ5789868.1 hypothetical protein N7518_006879 [Penicillium psychrosexuale]